MRTRTKFAICAVCAILLYTAASFWMSYNGKYVPDSLTTAFFAAWTVELGLLFGIKLTDRES